MKTIEERAKEYASKKSDISLSPAYNEALANIYEEAYIAGATEQKAINDAECVNQVLMGKGSAINHYKQGYHDAIDKSCEIVRNIANEYFGDWEQSCKIEDTFRKAMEE